MTQQRKLSCRVRKTSTILYKGIGIGSAEVHRVLTGSLTQIMCAAWNYHPDAHAPLPPPPATIRLSTCPAQDPIMPVEVNGTTVDILVDSRATISNVKEV